MVTGESGTFVRVFDMNFDFTGLIDDVSPELLLDMWYYDNATPLSAFSGSQGAPKYPNGFSLCSALLDEQVLIFKKEFEINDLHLVSLLFFRLKPGVLWAIKIKRSFLGFQILIQPDLQHTKIYLQNLATKVTKII